MKKLHILTFAFAVILVIVLANVNVHNANAIDNCVPSKQKEKKKEIDFVVTLDAGHGGYDSGSLSLDETIQEKDVTLSITKKVGEYLTTKGIQVIYTRESDEVNWPHDNVKDLDARIAVGANSNSDVFVSLHLNSFETDGISGFETWVNKQNEKAVRLAQLVQANLDTLNYSKNRGVKDVNLEPLQVITNNALPSVLVELGYITSSSDIAYLTNNEAQQELAERIGDAIVLYQNENG